MVEFLIKMDDNCKEKVTPDEAKEIFSVAQQVTKEFRQAYPGSHVDRVILDMHCKEEIECPQPIDQIVIKMQREEDDMPCFGCAAVFDDEQCYKNRHAKDEKGNEGTGCLRLPAFKKVSEVIA